MIDIWDEIFEYRFRWKEGDGRRRVSIVLDLEISAERYFGSLLCRNVGV